MFLHTGPEGDSFEGLAFKRDRIAMNEPVLITGYPQNYAWGKSGSNSLVAELIDQTSSSLPFAELWFGSHPNGSSTIIGRNEEGSLREVIAEHPGNSLGQFVIDRFGKDLPFLFKILSVGGPLSIQLHPTKEQAAVLHRQNPQLYKDSNHKPEIAISLTPITMFYGFRPFEEISLGITETKEFNEIVSKDCIELFLKADSSTSREAALKILYAELMGATLNDDGRRRIAGACSHIVSRLSSAVKTTAEESLVLELARKYPGDIGIFAPFLMNIVTVPQGQAIYTEPRIPHAYLSGDMVEVMANSDNVVRAGLTPKQCDVETLIEIVDCRMGLPEMIKPIDQAHTEFLTFKTSAKEFEVQVLEGNHQLSISTNQKPEILFPINCNGYLKYGSNCIEFQKGKGLFVPAAVSQYSLEVKQGRVFRVVVPA